MKTTMKRLAAYLLAMLLVLQIVPVMAEEGTYSAIFTPGYVQYRDILEITADIETSILTVDMENQLSATKGYDGIKWSSDHPEIATVDENGLVKAVAPGQVRITVEAEGYSDSVVLRLRSPRYIAPICGTAIWLSSMNNRAFFGKYSNSVGGGSPGARPVK